MIGLEKVVTIQASSLVRDRIVLSASVSGIEKFYAVKLLYIMMEPDYESRVNLERGMEGN